MTDFKPFDDEATSMAVDDLTIENRLDRIEIYGTLQITKDQAGLKLAKEMKNLIDATIAALEKEKLPKHIQTIAPDSTDNPFS